METSGDWWWLAAVGIALLCVRRVRELIATLLEWGAIVALGFGVLQLFTTPDGAETFIRWALIGGVLLIVSKVLAPSSSGSGDGGPQGPGVCNTCRGTRSVTCYHEWRSPSGICHTCGGSGAKSCPSCC